jgi:integrase
MIASGVFFMGESMAYVTTVNEYRHEIREKIKVNEKWRVSLVKSFRTRLEADAFVANDRLRSSVGEQVKLSLGKVKLSDALLDYVVQDLRGKKKHYPDDHPTVIRVNAWLTKDEYAWLVNKELGRVTHEEIDAFIEQREDADKAASTINRELNTLSPFFNWCKKTYNLKHWDNPVEMCRRPQVNDSRNRTLTNAERDTLEKACATSGSPMLRFAFDLAVETAIRRGELCQLRWDDVVLDNERSHINLRKGTTKTQQERTVPLSKIAIATFEKIEAWRKDRMCREVKLKERRTVDEIYDFDFVLAGVTPTAIGQAFRRVVSATDVKDFRFHDCRHCATTSLAEVFDLLELSQITGHKNPTMLKRYYNPKGATLALKLHARP